MLRVETQRDKSDWLLVCRWYNGDVGRLPNGIDGVSMMGHLGFDWTAPLSHHVLLLVLWWRHLLVHEREIIVGR